MKIFDNSDDYLYYFPKQKTYLMFNHRFSLWCWINKINGKEFGKFNLVHIDTHHDCGEIYPEEKKKIFLDNINEFKNINKFKQAKYNGSNLIGYGGFLGIALRINLFKKIFFFTRADNAPSSYKQLFENNNPPNSHKTNIEYFEKENFNKLKESLENNENIFLDLDLDYFTDSLSNPKKNFGKEKLYRYFKLIKNNTKNINIITVAKTNNNYSSLEKEFIKYFQLKI